MIIVVIFVKLLIAHILTDFSFQNQRFIALKEERIWFLALHAGIFAGLAMVLFGGDFSHPLIDVILLITASHFIIDGYKISLLEIKKAEGSPAVFIADQFLHIIVIIIAALALGRITFSNAGDVFTSWLNEPRFLILLLALVLVTSGTAAFVKAIMQSFLKELPSDGDKIGLENAGYYIGLFERLVILALTLTNNITGIGLIFAAKSVIRFPEAKDGKQFAEYYLVGTMTSFACALLVGFAVKYLLDYL